MCAAREGTYPHTYSHTRTPGEFSSAVLAWVESWATPMRVVTGGMSKGRGGSAGGGAGTATEHRPERSILDFVPQGRDSTGRLRRRNVYDLRKMLPLDKPWDPNVVQDLKKSIGPHGPDGIRSRRR
jgi:hypothetical protein